MGSERADIREVLKRKVVLEVSCEKSIDASDLMLITLFYNLLNAEQL